MNRDTPTRNRLSSKEPGVSSFVLKMAAIYAMTCNHAAYIFEGHLPFPLVCALFAAGGLTFPIMAFLLLEGYYHTSNIRKYAMRLGIFALVSQIPYGLFLGANGNVMFTLLLGLGVLYAYDHMPHRILFWLYTTASALVSLACDWGFLGIVMVMLFRVMRGERMGIAVPVFVAIAALGVPALGDMVEAGVYALPALLYPTVGCTSSILLISAYNGKRGRSLKWFFYAYYPLHIAVLGVIDHIAFA